MPWWVWVLCVMWLLAALTGGVAYAVVHALRLMRGMGETGRRISVPLGAMGDAHVERADPDDPSFVQPLASAVDRYVDAHAGKLRRKSGTENRHAAEWKRWANDNWADKR